MKIPKKIKLQGREFEVIFAEEKEMGGKFGEVYHKYSQIKISRNIGKAHQGRVFLEEIIHAILDESGHYKKNDDERFVHTLSSMLYAVLKENKLWFGYEENRKKRKRVAKSPSKAS